MNDKKENNMQKVNHPLKARMFVGGLKSLLIGVVETLDNIEKTGAVSKDFVEELGDVRTAIDLTLVEFKKVTIRCCDHGSSHETCDESCDDETCDDEYDTSCDVCGESEQECECDLEETDPEDEDEEPPPPPPRRAAPKPASKKNEIKANKSRLKH
jgi:hypothetical protein